MKTTHTVIVIGSDPEAAQQYLAELAPSGSSYNVILVRSFSEAREAAARREPNAVLVDESPISQGDHVPGVLNGSLREAALSLSRLAPVVVVAPPERQSELADLIAAGVADFVPRVGNFVPLAAALIERRMRQCEPPSLPVYSSKDAGEEDFGEVLRHEVNNPLTGILGNAELLLAELRRRKDNSMPLTAQQRLQTIADLAVRLRETVRRLSDDLQNRDQHARML